MPKLLADGERQRISFQPADSHGVEIPYEVTIEVGMLGGRLRCINLQVAAVPGGPPVTTEGLRSLPIAGLTQEAAVLAGLDDGWELPPADFAARRGTVDAELLTQVAQVYRWAAATGRPPYGVFASRYGVNRGTASRWVSIARRRGHLPSAQGVGRTG